MAEIEPTKVITVDLPSGSVAEAHEAIAAQHTANAEVQLPHAPALSIGELVSVEVRVKGEGPLVVPAKVVRHGSAGRGVVIRWTAPPQASVSASMPLLTADALATFGKTGVEAYSLKRSSQSKGQATNPTAPQGQLIAAFEALGTYQILKRLGGGGMAQVYLARSQLGGQVDKLVALKTVLPEYGPTTELGSLFLEEARVSATLQHSNVVQVFDFGEANGQPYLAMEYVHGRTVGALLQRQVSEGRPAREDIAVFVAMEICRALEYVHERTDLDGTPLNLVHRDISPTNIIISAQGEVKLLDFGVAAVEGGEHDVGAVGKYGYMAPQQARGERPAPNWDLFGLGVVMYEMLTLRRFCRVNTAKEHAAFFAANPDRRPSLVAPGLDPGLDALVAKATSPDPSQRFSSAAEFRRALLPIAEWLGPPDVRAFVADIFGAELTQEEGATHLLVQESRGRASLPPRPVTRAPKPTRHWPAAVSLVVGVLAVIAAIAWPRPVNTVTVALAATPTKVEPVPVQPSPPSPEVTATLTSTPPGARVVRLDSNETLGVTPLTLLMGRQDSPLDVRFTLPGYIEVLRQLPLASDVAVDVTLVPVQVKRLKKKKRVTRDGLVDPY